MSKPEPKVVDVLLVDDEDGDRKKLARAFKGVAAKDFRFQVWEAASVEQYHDAIKARSERVTPAPRNLPDRVLFHAMVVDVRLSPMQDGDDDLVHFHHLLSPGTIIVVCSAFLGVDKVRTCVRAMHAGATDCVDKGNVQVDWPKSVRDSVLSELRHRHSEDRSPTSAWLEQHIDQLVKDYPGQAIAMLGQRVVASGRNLAELRAQLPSLRLKHTPYFMVVPNWDH